MRVLHAIASVDPAHGGPSTVMRALARGLGSEGVDIEVATLCSDSAAAHACNRLREPVLTDGVVYRFFPVQTRRYSVSIPLLRWLAGAVRNYDLVHCHGLFTFAPLAAAKVAARHRVPYVVRPVGSLGRWGMANRRRLAKAVSFRLVERPILEHAAAVLYATDKEMNEAAELNFPHTAVVIPNPIESGASFDAASGRAFRERFAISTDAQMVLFLGRLDPIKGLDVLFPAFAKVRLEQPDAVLVIAGGGNAEYGASLHAQAERLGISRSVVWTGFLFNEDKWAALSACDVFVLPSHSENFGVSALEAMQCTKAVIVTDGVGLHTDIERAAAGLVAQCTPESISAAVLQLFRDSDMRTRLGAAGKRLADERFGLASVSRSHIALYEKVLSRSPVCALN